MPADSKRRSHTLLAAVSLAVGLVVSAPLLYLGWRSARLGSELPTLWTSHATTGPLWRTTQLAVLASLASMAVGTGLAWLTTRTDLPWRRAFGLVLPLPLVVPSFVGASAYLAAFAPGGLLDGMPTPPTHGLAGAVIVITLFSFPYVYLPVAARLSSLPPSLEESARLLGRSPRQVFREVVLPQTWGSVAAGGLLVFLYAVSDFGAVSLMRYDTLTRAIYSSRLFDRDRSVALSLFLGLLAVAVVAAERAVGPGRLASAVAAAPRGRALQIRLGRWKAPATLGVGAVVVASLLTPVAVLAYWAVRGRATGGWADLVGPTLSSALAGILAALAAVAVMLPVAYLTTRHRGLTADVANALVVAGFGLPGLVTAIGLIFFALQTPTFLGLYQSMPLLILAYVTHFGAQSLRASQVAVGGVSPRIDDAARILGAGPARRFFAVDIPLMAPGLLAGAGLVLMSTLKELPATLLLAPIGFRTLATRIWGAAEDGFLADVGLASLVLVALSCVLTWALVIRGAEHVA